MCGCITLTGILILIFDYVFCCRCSGPLIKRVYTCNGLWFDGSAVRVEFQTYRLYRLWDFGYWTEKICVRGQQRTWQWTSYKHFDITQQKNVGGGRLARVGWGRGWETVARTGLQWKIYVVVVVYILNVWNVWMTSVVCMLNNNNQNECCW